MGFCKYKVVVIRMKIDDLFEKRSLVAAKLKECLKERGYTKVSFAKVTDISRPTLDKILSGEVNNKSTFSKHIDKILSELNLSAEELLFYESASQSDNTVYLQNFSKDYQMSEKERKQFGLLRDIVELCEIYY
jgi:transcriptional regulator with XRE-family HTH domain